ncbi:hypothetical protein TWF481_009016 [Arthrobotrys musiformis]|uniref:NmrA-like domain-containing protein n=1 Tax=Arthrobotrys musiformis TaxID=47236 RepID=A0AAV9W3G4_9PEZI
MAKLPVVAVAGGTGVLGKEIVRALLDPQFRSRYQDVVLLTRNAASPNALEGISKGAIAREYSTDNDQTIAAALAGVDILVNVVAPVDKEFESKIAAAVTSPSSNVKLYLPSEFGVEHYLHDFKHPVWGKKKIHFEAVSARKDLKVCLVFPGLFTEHSIGPWFGLNTKEGKYEFIGSGDTPVSFTSIVDIGNAVASALANIPVESFPEKLYFSGDAVSLRQVAELMKDAGAGEIKVSNLDLAEYKAKTTSNAESDPAACLRFLMAEGKINNEKNDNELVNPGEKVWKWKKMKGYAQETRGRPWANL